MALNGSKTPTVARTPIGAGHGAEAPPANPSADIEGVKAASKVFYEAVVVVDDGTAMDKVWAHKPYVTLRRPEKRVHYSWLGRAEDVLAENE